MWSFTVFSSCSTEPQLQNSVCPLTAPPGNVPGLDAVASPHLSLVALSQLQQSECSQLCFSKVSVFIFFVPADGWYWRLQLSHRKCSVTCCRFSSHCTLTCNCRDLECFLKALLILLLCSSACWPGFFGVTTSITLVMGDAGPYTLYGKRRNIWTLSQEAFMKFLTHSSPQCNALGSNLSPLSGFSS